MYGNEGTPKERLLRRKLHRLAMTEVVVCHCEEGRFLLRRSNLWYPGTICMGMREPQKRDCHGSWRGLAMTRGRLGLAMTRERNVLAMAGSGSGPRNNKEGERPRNDKT